MEETTLLKNEVVRLNKIITILLNHVEMLLAQNALLITHANGNSLNDTLHKSADMVKFINDTILKNEYIINKINDTIQKNEHTININNDTILKSDDRVKQVNDTILKSDGMINQNNDTILENEGMIKPIIDTIPKSEYMISTINDALSKSSSIIRNINDTIEKSSALENSPQMPLPKVVPAKIEFSNANLQALRIEVKRNLHHNTKWEKVNNVVSELLLLHNQGSATAKELRGFIGLSKPGFAKHLPTLKRGDFIKYQSPKKYVLTERSINMIKKVFGKEIKPENS